MKALLIALAACSHAIAVPVEPVISNNVHLSCSLPSRPTRFAVIGWAEPSGITVSKSDMASLIVYLEGVATWMDQVAECLK